jgi:hypothetical protein
MKELSTGFQTIPRSEAVDRPRDEADHFMQVMRDQFGMNQFQDRAENLAN